MDGGGVVIPQSSKHSHVIEITPSTVVFSAHSQLKISVSLPVIFISFTLPLQKGCIKVHLGQPFLAPL